MGAQAFGLIGFFDGATLTGFRSTLIAPGIGGVANRGFLPTVGRLVAPSAASGFLPADEGTETCVGPLSTGAQVTAVVFLCVGTARSQSRKNTLRLVGGHADVPDPLEADKLGEAARLPG